MGDVAPRVRLSTSSIQRGFTAQVGGWVDGRLIGRVYGRLTERLVCLASLGFLASS